MVTLEYYKIESALVFDCHRGEILNLLTIMQRASTPENT